MRFEKIQSYKYSQENKDKKECDVCLQQYENDDFKNEVNNISLKN